MMNEISKINRKLEELYVKCYKDLDFKSSLMNHPLQTIEKFLGCQMTLKKNEHILVEDQSDPSKIFLNIPRKIDIDELELTDEQLEQVSGGDIFVGVLIGATVYFLARSAGQEYAIK